MLYFVIKAPKLELYVFGLVMIVTRFCITLFQFFSLLY